MTKRIAALNAKAAQQRAARCIPSAVSPIKIRVSLATHSDRDVWVRFALGCALEQLGYVELVPAGGDFDLDATVSHGADPLVACRVDVVLSRAGQSRPFSRRASVQPPEDSELALQDCIDAIIGNIVASQVDDAIQHAATWTTPAPRILLAPPAPPVTIFGPPHP